MIERYSTEVFLNLRDQGHFLIDVRTPSEFEQGHIPGAVNIPLFSDEERSQVGTLYKQVNKEAALYAGLEYAGSKLVLYLKALKKLSNTNNLLLYCWRGGMRSSSLAWLFQLAGYSCHLLEGGYKAYRQSMLTSFEQPAKLVVVGGLTGTGKSDILRELVLKNEQVILLEDYAHHKGSAFGGLGQLPQPSSMQFENMLYEEWRKYDRSKRIFIEDESPTIGSVSIPSGLFKQMRSSMLYLLELPLNCRKNRIAAEYAHFETEKLIESVVRIQKRLGSELSKSAISALEQEKIEDAIEIILSYYDKAYHKGNQKRPESKVFKIKLEADKPSQNANILLLEIRGDTN